MGRKKLEIKPILDNSCRQIAFCKRRKGLIKKARELSILCDVDVGVVIVSNRGRLHEFSSTNSLTGILQRYESHAAAEKKISAEIQDAESKFSSMTTGELLQETERQLEENVDGVTATDLIHLENELLTALVQIRSRKTHLMLESIKGLHEKEKLLLEEKKQLENNMARMKKNRRVNEKSDLPQQRVTLNFL
ncbi:agamous-like MADS-box protein AGL70 [Capsicum annuum]|uniref:agamous-like MADS-box protein AGL70 n=1 Tax=Capsicum annuum TaxID=4072 RepID=UPI001FB10695|nr:agamous-like MADS-box protein AGL70 [Capsicum annuum]